MARELYPFRFRDPVTGKWVRARYCASLDDIARRYRVAEVIGKGRPLGEASKGFDPYRKAAPRPEWRRIVEPSLQFQPLMSSALERTLVAIFLRRYVTWCARGGRYAAMNGAARLLRNVGAVAANDSADGRSPVP